MGDIPGIVAITASGACLALGHLIRRVGEEVRHGNTAGRGESTAPTAEPVVADDGFHRSADRRRDHRPV